MRLTHPDYIKLVMRDYRMKELAGTLSMAFTNPKRAKIKDECSRLYSDKAYDKKDDKILLAFFGPLPPGVSYTNTIKNCNAEKFRTLVNYLKGLTRETDDKNIHLLAWLIGFEPRPYRHDMEVPPGVSLEDLDEPLPSPAPTEPEQLASTANTTSQPDVSDALDANSIEITHQSNLTKESGADTEQGIPADMRGSSEDSEKAVTASNAKYSTDTTKPASLGIMMLPAKPKRGRKKQLSIVLAVLLGAACLVGGGYALRPNAPQGLLSANPGCMSWTGDHYEVVPCSENRPDRLKLPLDLEKLKNFKRILKEDTITEKSIGNIYYIRIHGGIEYYTAGGHHPVEVTKYLQKLTAHMYYEHLAKGLTDRKPE